MIETQIGDAVRFTVLVTGGVLLALSIVTTGIYARVFYRDRRLSRAQGVPFRWRGLLPSHVALIGTSYILLVVHGLWFVTMRIGRPMFWSGLLLAVAMGAGVAAQWTLLQHQRRMYPRHPDDVPPLTTPGRR